MHRMMPAMRSVLLGAAAATIFVTTTSTQSILGPPSEANHFIETPKGWVHPKTSWGEPDIQATLNMMQAAERAARAVRQQLPLRRPALRHEQGVVDRGRSTSSASPRRAGRGDLGRELIAKGEFGRALLTGVTDPATPQRQTSLIVDPPNGLLPALTPEAKRRALQMGSSWSLPGEDTVYDGPLDFDFWDNCRSRGMPSSMMPYRYNGGFKIHQAPGVVVFDLEMIHDTRVIFTDGRPPLASAHKQYMGESRGRWEGNTLVVETTNYKEGPPLINLAVVGLAGRQPLPGQRQAEDDRADHAPERRHVPLRDQDRGSGHPHAVVHRALPDAQRPHLRVVGIRAATKATRSCRTTAPRTATSARTRRRSRRPSRRRRRADVANALAGRWSGQPKLATIDYNIFLEFTKNADGTVQGKLIGTDLKTFGGKVPTTINKALRDFTMKDRRLNFEFPNTQPWTFAGELSADGTSITGTVNSAQGGMPITFRKG